MDWKREAESRLREYADRKSSLRRTELELHRLDAKLTSIRAASTDKTPIRGGGNGREDALINTIVERDELEAARKDTVRWLSVTDNALAQLTEEERHILGCFYISRERGAAEMIAEELHIEKTHVYRKRNAALRRFTLLLYGAI